MGLSSTISSTATARGGVLGMDHFVLHSNKQKCFNLPARPLRMPPPSSLNLLANRKSTLKSSTIMCKAQEAANEVVALTDSSWDSLVVGSKSPVLVEFWAPWCGPCRMIAPVIDELAKDYAGKLACYKVNTDDCPGIATKCGIRSIPTVLLFRNGEKKESVIGAVPKSTLTATIDKYMD